MGSIRRFATLAVATTLVGCASFERWLDKLEGKESRPTETRSTATPSKPASKPATPPAKPEPPPPTWSMAFPGGATLKFGAVESFPEVDPIAMEELFAELCSAGWTREFMGYPQIYFVQIDNRKGKKGLRWTMQDQVLVAANGRTIEQDTSFQYGSVLRRFGGFDRAVLPGTTATIPVAFVSSLPMRSLTSVWVLSDGKSLALTSDKQPGRPAEAQAAAPAR